eukprot:scaffold192970_cov23-Tisochrysis_lutea.AAC.1
MLRGPLAACGRDRAQAMLALHKPEKISKCTLLRKGSCVSCCMGPWLHVCRTVLRPCSCNMRQKEPPVRAMHAPERITTVAACGGETARAMLALHAPEH